MRNHPDPRVGLEYVAHRHIPAYVAMIDRALENLMRSEFDTRLEARQYICNLLTDYSLKMWIERQLDGSSILETWLARHRNLPGLSCEEVQTFRREWLKAMRETLVTARVRG